MYCTWNSSHVTAGASSALSEAAWILMQACLPTDCWASSKRPRWKVATDIYNDEHVKEECVITFERMTFSQSVPS